MANRQSQERYEGGGQVRYLVYESPQRLQGGHSQQRTRVKRLYFPSDARDISLDRPGTVEKRTGRRVHGVAVHYRHHLPHSRARRGKTEYHVPERWVSRTKVVELPAKADSLKLTTNPPPGPKQAVR